MAQNLTVDVKSSIGPHQIKLPKGVNDRLRRLLDKQDRGDKLTKEEKREAEGLVELAEMLSLLRLERFRPNVRETSLYESADLYEQIYSEDEDLRELTELAILEPVHD